MEIAKVIKKERSQLPITMLLKRVPAVQSVNQRHNLQRPQHHQKQQPTSRPHLQLMMGDWDQIKSIKHLNFHCFNKNLFKIFFRRFSIVFSKRVFAGFLRMYPPRITRDECTYWRYCNSTAAKINFLFNCSEVVGWKNLSSTPPLWVRPFLLWLLNGCRLPFFENIAQIIFIM